MLNLAVAKVLEPALTGTRWDVGEALAAEHLTLIDEQYGPGFNIVDQIRMTPLVSMYSRYLLPLRQTSDSAERQFLLWIAGQKMNTLDWLSTMHSSSQRSSGAS